MSSQDFMKILEGTDYSFLHENEHLANKIMLLGLSGSYGYGTIICDQFTPEGPSFGEALTSPQWGVPQASDLSLLA